MASCLVPESPAVVVTLGRLKELEKQLKEEGAPFAGDAGVYLTAISASVSELEASRRAAHKKLEVETVENVKLKDLSERVREQLLADIAAVQASSAGEMEQLHGELRVSRRLQEEAAERLQSCLSYNNTLQEEKEKVRGEHEAFAASLNAQINLKTRTQVEVEQMLESIEEMKSTLSAVEQERSSVQTVMLAEKEALWEKKKNLVKEVEKTGQEITHVRRAITLNKNRLDKVNTKKKECQNQLDHMNCHLAKLEDNLQQAKASRSKFELKLQDESKKNSELRKRIEKVKKDSVVMKETFSSTCKALHRRIASVEGDSKAARSSVMRLSDRLAQARDALKLQQNEEEEVRVEHLHLSQQLERSKLDLEERITFIMKHRKQVMEMGKRIKKLQEKEGTNKELFEIHREELCLKMDEVTENIQQLEEKEQHLRKLLQDAIRRQEEHVAKIKSDIRFVERRYEELLKEEADFMRQQSMSPNVESLQAKVDQMKEEYRQIQSIHLQEVQQVKAERAHILSRTEGRQRRLQEEEEVLKGVEAKFAEEQSRQRRLKALSEELSRRRAEAELSIRSVKEANAELLQSQKQTKAELEKLQEAEAGRLSQQNAALRAAEVSCYNSSVLLEQVQSENGRMRRCIARMTEDINSCRSEQQRYQAEAQKLCLKRESMFKDLQQEWDKDLLIVQDHERRDTDRLKATKSLSNGLQTRKQQLSSVGKMLHQIMLDFSQRLGEEGTVGRHL